MFMAVFHLSFFFYFQIAALMTMTRWMAAGPRQLRQLSKSPKCRRNLPIQPAVPEDPAPLEPPKWVSGRVMFIRWQVRTSGPSELQRWSNWHRNYMAVIKDRWPLVSSKAPNILLPELRLVMQAWFPVNVEKPFVHLEQLPQTPLR